MFHISINGNNIELDNNSEITLSTTLRSIAKLDTLNGEFSFSFNIPTTPSNNKILGYTNDISVYNKFNTNYKALITIDDIVVLEGNLLINSIDSESYKCNVYINKTNTLNDIFGDMKLSEINWEVDYKQDITINDENAKELPEIIYPLVSYGQFQRESVNGKYTSIFDLDNTTKLYNENFLPSPNILSLIKKCFESKGYEVDGNIFSDNLLKNIYLSTNISDKQDFIYPYGNTSGEKAMGFATIRGNFSNYSGTTSPVQAQHALYDIEFPQFGVRDNYDYKYNWTEVCSYNVFNILGNNSNYGSFTQILPDGGNTSMWAKNRIVIPTSGFYKIEMKLGDLIGQTEAAKIERPDKAGTMTIQEWTYTSLGEPAVLQDKMINVDSNEMFMELQLLKNTDSVEYLPIAPYYNLTSLEGKPTEYNTYSAYKHEAKGVQEESTDLNQYTGGYVPRSGQTLNYDPSVNPNFVCGITKTGPYCYTSVAKNGRSWDLTCSDVNRVRSSVEPYFGIKQTYEVVGTRPKWTRTPEMTADYGKNTLPYSEGNQIHEMKEYFDTRIQLIMYLEKNDWLQLHLLTRRFEYPYGSGEQGGRDIVWDTPVHFPFEITVSAFSPDDVPLDSDEIFDWSKPSRFPQKLQVNTFLNNETKISDFIDNFLKTFNLSYIQNGNNITINTQKSDNKNVSTIDLSNRWIDYDFEKIDFPYSMQVKFDINDDEFGFMESIPDDKIDLPDYKQYADIGSENIILNGLEGNEEQSTDFSYCWYHDFNVKKDETQKITIPVIAKDEWMIDGYKVDENMKQDGYGLKQRMFLKGTQDSSITYGLYEMNGNLQIKHLPLYNIKDGIELSYKKYDTNNDTLLKRYFDTDYSTSVNYLNLTCYVTADEYMRLKSGTNVIFNDNEYQVVSIEYSSDGECKLKLVSL